MQHLNTKFPRNSLLFIICLYYKFNINICKWFTNKFLITAQKHKFTAAQVQDLVVVTQDLADSDMDIESNGQSKGEDDDTLPQ